MGMGTGGQQEEGRANRPPPASSLSAFTSARQQPSPWRSRDAHLQFIFNSGGAGVHADVCGAVRKHGSAHTAGPSPVERARRAGEMVGVTAGRSGGVSGRPEQRRQLLLN